jgi:predicted acylesterase/phospholipase RssA
MNDYQTAIVFQGGGALGAYEYGVIKALYEERPKFKPAAVTGISIGAINAALMAGAKHDPLEALDQAWRNRFAESLSRSLQLLLGPLASRETQQAVAAFGNPGMFQLRMDHPLAPCRRTSIYNLEPLERTLRELIDIEKLNRPDDIRIVVGGVNVETGEINYFDNGKQALGIEHIIASASLPPVFPFTPIGEHYYWDGGLVQNTPLSPAINCLEQLSGDWRREVIVVELFPMAGPVPKGMADVINRLGELSAASKLKIDRKLFKTIDSIITFLQKIEPHIPQEFRDEPAYQELFVQHKKIDALTVITAHFVEGQANAGDFSSATIESRIKLGYEQAKHQDIGNPHPVD